MGGQACNAKRARECENGKPLRTRDRRKSWETGGTSDFLGIVCLEVLENAGEGLLASTMAFPVTEIADEVFAHLVWSGPLPHDRAWPAGRTRPVAKGEFPRKLFAQSNNVAVHGSTREPKFLRQHRHQRPGLPALAESVDRQQPLGPALPLPEFARAFFLLPAFGSGTSSPSAANNPARWAAQLLADLSNPFARKAILSGQDHVHGGREFAFQVLAGRPGNFFGSRRALVPQHAALPQELHNVVYGQPEPPRCFRRRQALPHIQAQDGRFLWDREWFLVVRAFHRVVWRGWFLVSWFGRL